MSNLYSIEYEKAFLSAIIQTPDILLDYLNILDGKDFTSHNGIIYEIIKNIYQNKGAISVLTVSEKAKSLNLTIEGIEIFDYLSALNRTPINLKEIKDVAKEIKKLSLIRHVISETDKLKNQIIENRDKPAKEIFTAIDETLSKSYQTFDISADEPTNIYEKVRDCIEERGNTPVEIVGYTTPYKTFNDYYGGIRNGQIICIASRTGNGKSTFLLNTLDRIVNDLNIDQDVKGLFLDTEMEEQDNIIRLVAAKTGCPYYLLDSGQWRKNLEWYSIVRDEIKKLSSNKRNNLFFKQVGSMGIKDLSNYIKRWYYNKIGKGNKCIIAYDYLKILMADKISHNTSEWQLALDKLQMLKDVIDEIQAPLLTAIQVNRTGIITNRFSHEIVDDESVISTSDRIAYIVSMLAILRRKTADEMIKDGQLAGTHKCIVLKSRFQGIKSFGHHDLVKVMIDNKVQYKLNYINFNIDNFKVDDCGSFRELAALKGWTNIKKEENNDNAKDVEL